MLLYRVGSRHFHVLFGTIAIRFDGRKCLIQDIDVLIPIEVEIFKFRMKVTVLISYLLDELLSPFLDLFLVDVESQQVDFNGSLHIFIFYISYFQLSHPRMP